MGESLSGPTKGIGTRRHLGETLSPEFEWALTNAKTDEERINILKSWQATLQRDRDERERRASEWRARDEGKRHVAAATSIITSEETKSRKGLLYRPLPSWVQKLVGSAVLVVLFSLIGLMLVSRSNSPEVRARRACENLIAKQIQETPPSMRPSSADQRFYINQCVQDLLKLPR